MNRFSLPALTCALLVLAGPSAAAADPVRCATSIVRNAALYAQKRAVALAKCEGRVVTGKLSAGTNCELEPKTATLLARLEAKARTKIAKDCGGADRPYETGGDDEPLGSVGWDVGSCPASDDCDAPISDCDDIADCLLCAASAATEQDSTLVTGEFEDAGAGGEVLSCQKAIVKASSKFFRLRSKALAKCWTSVSKGTATGPCPDPGDGKAVAFIERARDKMVAKVCKACGGSDDGCDDSAGGVPGTGGTDDLDVALIGFVDQCPDVTAPGGAPSCAASVTTVGGLVDCILCAGDFEGLCVDLLGVPWSQAYPATCVLEDAPDTCEAVVHTDDFTLPDASAWPSPWTVQPNVAESDIQSGRARLRPTLEPSYSLARMTADLPAPESDVEVTFTFEFGDSSSQGIGFYVRQNGGHLQLTPTHGQGYAVFVEGYAVFGEGGGQQGIGLWKEVDGVEINLTRTLLPAASMLDGVRYRARFRVNQASPTQTWLRARFWPEAGVEPSTWHTEILDNEPVVQNVAGGIAVDSWSRYNQGNPGVQGDTFVDDIEVTTLCNPLAGVAAPTLVADNFSATPFEFTEGPRWRPADGVLLFTDLNLETIYELTPPATVAEFRTGSNAANGLANDINGDLLACEHASRRVSRTDSLSTITTVTDNFSGDAYHSPNDLAVRSDGTIYFTDPQYGTAAHGQPLELTFNGLFRVAPGGTVTAEWMGGLAAGPNGVVLSPDEDVLYMARTDTGEVLAWDVAVDGSLSNQRVFASGLVTPDGLCMDSRGNLFVAEWTASAATGSLRVYDPSGLAWGSIPVGHSPTNCGFGGADATSLYITAHEGYMSNVAGIYHTAVPVAGLY